MDLTVHMHMHTEGIAAAAHTAVSTYRRRAARRCVQLCTRSHTWTLHMFAAFLEALEMCPTDQLLPAKSCHESHTLQPPSTRMKKSEANMNAHEAPLWTPRAGAEEYVCRLL